MTTFKHYLSTLVLMRDDIGRLACYADMVSTTPPAPRRGTLDDWTAWLHSAGHSDLETALRAAWQLWDGFCKAEAARERVKGALARHSGRTKSGARGRENQHHQHTANNVLDPATTGKTR